MPLTLRPQSPKTEGARAFLAAPKRLLIGGDWVDGAGTFDTFDPATGAHLATLARADAGLMVLREAPLFSFGVSPNKLFDYLAAGLPVVCNVPGEVAQMLSQAHAGVQAADASAMALAEAVSALAGLDARERRERGRSGRDWVERTHSRQILASSLENGLANLITP